MKNYQLTNWISFHWTKQTRYYKLILHQDLWGNWIVTRAWGRIGTKQGSTKAHAIGYREGLQLLAKLSKIRKYRKYERITGRIKTTY